VLVDYRKSCRFVVGICRVEVLYILEITGSNKTHINMFNFSEFVTPSLLFTSMYYSVEYFSFSLE